MEPIFLSAPPELSRVRMAAWQTSIPTLVLRLYVNCGRLKSLYSILRMCLSPARSRGFDEVSNDAAVVSRFFKRYIK